DDGLFWSFYGCHRSRIENSIGTSILRRAGRARSSGAEGDGSNRLLKATTRRQPSTPRTDGAAAATRVGLQVTSYSLYQVAGLSVCGYRHAGDRTDTRIG